MKSAKYSVAGSLSSVIPLDIVELYKSSNKSRDNDLIAALSDSGS